jgi:predicted Zn-dependent protease
MQRPRYAAAIVIFLLSFQFYLSSCASVSPLGADAELQLAEDEKRIWNRSREEAKRLDNSGQLHESVELSEYVNGVMNKLVPADLRQKNFTITVKVIKNPLLNAFALAHGVIYIHSGFLAKIENEAQLAAVLSHELVHITHRHMLQSFRGLQSASTAVAALQLAGIPFGLYGTLASLLGSFGATAAISGYSRALESEADVKGFELLVGAGYDPAEAPRLFELLKADLQDREISEPFFFGSHPRLAERKDNWAALVAERVSAKPGEKGTERYSEKVRELLLETVQMDLSYGRWSWAEATIKRYIDLNPHEPEGYFYLGELFRRRGAKEDRGEAEKEYRLAAQLNPAYAPPYGGLGKVYLVEGRRDEARKEFARYLSLAPYAADRAYIEEYLRVPEKSDAPLE